MTNCPPTPLPVLGTHWGRLRRLDSERALGWPGMGPATDQDNSPARRSLLGRPYGTRGVHPMSCHQCPRNRVNLSAVAGRNISAWGLCCGQCLFLPLGVGDGLGSINALRYGVAAYRPTRSSSCGEFHCLCSRAISPLTLSPRAAFSLPRHAALPARAPAHAPAL
jgi:hypothetical protein